MGNLIYTMNKHQKHTALTRKKNGLFAPNEVAILGAKCSIITELVHQISSKLSQYKMAYFDASHAKDVEPNSLSTYTFHDQGNLAMTTIEPVNQYVQRIQFSQYDFVFTNGNHYPGEKQIVLLDPEKEASINKRIDQITNIQFFVKLSDSVLPFQSLKEKFTDWKKIPTYGIGEVEKITEHVFKIVSETTPTIKGLVLTGGKSIRMGKDKSLLEYHGKPQKEFVKDLLEAQGLETYFSVKNNMGKGDEIFDTFLNLGPFGGICSAFQNDPNSAWMVMATDVPFVNDELIKQLIEKRNPAKTATTVKGKSKQFPEPLITIYEPKAYPVLLQYLAQGYSCPRKMIINAEVEVIEVDDSLIQNINTPEEYEAIKGEFS